jgi:hypothetical protein
MGPAAGLRLNLRMRSRRTFCSGGDNQWRDQVHRVSNKKSSCELRASQQLVSFGPASGDGLTQHRNPDYVRVDAGVIGGERGTT